jgi:hypothetical protein
MAKNSKVLAPCTQVLPSEPGVPPTGVPRFPVNEEGRAVPRSSRLASRTKKRPAEMIETRRTEQGQELEIKLRGLVRRGVTKAPTVIDWYSNRIRQPYALRYNSQQKSISLHAQ